jgi:hypothetical protein
VFKEGKDKMKIKKIGKSEEEKDPISYCPSCLEYGIYSVLQERIYLPGQPIPYDYDLWKQSHNCCLLVPIYEAKRRINVARLCRNFRQSL